MPRQRSSRVTVYLRAPLAMKVALEVMQELAEERAARPARPTTARDAARRGHGSRARAGTPD